MKVGDLPALHRCHPVNQQGKHLRPRSKAAILNRRRQFFRDCQDWEWIPVRFSPVRYLQTPRSIRTLIGPDPRVIDTEWWAYVDTGYLETLTHTVKVLIDQDAVLSGAASSGEMWKYYDLGHGYCTCTFFEQCRYRMACARCSYYLPKSSSLAQLLEGKANLLRMQQEIPLTEEERAAVEEGIEALEKLLKKLEGVPTADDITPSRMVDCSLPIQVTPPSKSSMKKEQKLVPKIMKNGLV